MPATTNKSRTHPKERSSFAALLSGWAQQGVENFLATQQILLDLAIRQNAGVMRLFREQFTNPGNSPAKVLTELTGEGITNFIEAQRVLLDLAQQQNTIVMTGVKERVSNSATASALADVLRRSVENFIDMQQEFLKIAGRQTHSWLEANKAGKPLQGRQWVELAREATQNFIHAQKKFLDVVGEEIQNGRKRPAAAGKKVKATELSELARQAVNSFVDAQRKLFNVAGRQVRANVKAASEAASLVRPFPFAPLADLTREGVKSYVDASKALIDVVRKRPAGQKQEVKTKHRAKPTVTHAKTEAAHAAAVA